MRHHDLLHNFTAGGNIFPWRIVKFGSADYQVLQASANSDLMFGVSYFPQASNDPLKPGDSLTNIKVIANERLDVVMTHVAEVEYGAAVTRGQYLTSDASGRAIPAVPGAGVRVIGMAMLSGVLGDIGSVWIQPGGLAS
jgi:hypothetical protein